MVSKKTARIFYGIILLASSILAPWWIVAVLAVIGAFFFNQLYEAIIAGLLIDLIFYTNDTELLSLPILFTLGGFVIYGLSEFLNKYLRLYE